MSTKARFFALAGQMRSGKNHMMVDPRTGKHYPSKKFAEWRDAMVEQVALQNRNPRVRFTTPCVFKVAYTPGDLHRRDMPGIMDALFHVLERAGVVSDDALLDQCAGWGKMPLDRKNPRLTIYIEEARSVVQRAGRRPDGTAWANLNINDLAAKVEALRVAEPTSYTAYLMLTDDEKMKLLAQRKAKEKNDAKP